MRIIAGTRKGVRLSSFRKHDIRPTTDSTKELIFNVLKGKCSESKVLDVFAGTGGLGIEALSRGAVKAIFIENDRYAQKIILHNLQKTDFHPKAKLLRGAADKAFKSLAEAGETFDIILADPPYDDDAALTTLLAVQEYRLLESGGWLVIEQRHNAELQSHAGAFSATVIKRNGDSKIYFFQHGKKQ